MKQGAVALLVFFFLIWADLQTGFAHREITNKSGKPVRVMELKDTEGKPFARLFMTGEKMSIDHYQYPESGAGYYEALEGQTYYIPFTRGGLGGLHVQKIAWDDTGKTTAVKGLRPYFEGGENIPIVSDVADPRIEDGILYLQLEGKGKKEYAFSIRFGIGLTIEPPLYE